MARRTFTAEKTACKRHKSIKQLYFFPVLCGWRKRCIHRKRNKNKNLNDFKGQERKLDNILTQWDQNSIGCVIQLLTYLPG